MIYRTYLPDDFDALYAVEEQCFEPLFRFPSHYMRRLVGRSDAVTWIAEENGRMAGFAVVEWQNQIPRKLAYLVTIEVLSAYRGRGVGRELLGRVESSARAAGAEAVWLHVDAENVGAIRLYEANGYRPAGREENFYPKGRAALIYQKPLEQKPLTVSLL